MAIALCRSGGRSAGGFSTRIVSNTVSSPSPGLPKTHESHRAVLMAVYTSGMPSPVTMHSSTEAIPVQCMPPPGHLTEPLLCQPDRIRLCNYGMLTQELLFTPIMAIHNLSKHWRGLLMVHM